MVGVADNPKHSRQCLVYYSYKDHPTSIYIILHHTGIELCRTVLGFIVTVVIMPDGERFATIGNECNLVIRTLSHLIWNRV